MRNLKKLVCGRYSEELLTAYNKIRNNPRRYVNSSFEFAADSNMDHYEEIENEF